MLAFVEPACWLAACWDCNSNKLTDRKLWPLERQLALKLRVDPLRFNAEAVAKIFAPRLIDWPLVFKHYVEFQREERQAA